MVWGSLQLQLHAWHSAHEIVTTVNSLCSQHRLLEAIACRIFDADLSMYFTYFFFEAFVLIPLSTDVSRTPLCHANQE